MTPGPTVVALRGLAAPLRRLAVVGVGLGAVGAVLLALAAPAWLARVGVVRSPLWVVAAWALALVAAAAAALVARRGRAALADRRLAELLESRPGWRLGSVTGILDGGATGTSGDLFGAADGACASRVSTDGTGALADLRTGLRRRTRIGAGLLALAALIFLGAGPFRHPASALWAPAEAWASFMAPVRLAADREVVDRGQSVRLDATASGRQTAQLWVRGKGETWRSEALPLDSMGRASRTLGPLEGDVYAFVAAGGRSSDTVLVRVRLPAFLGSLTLTASYPAYLGLDDEPLPISGDTLLLPAGTRLAVAGEATADLASAGWRTSDGQAALEVDGRAFRGTLRPRTSGTIVLMLAMRDGAPLGGDPVALPIEIVPDRPPEIDLPVPDADTMMVLGTDVALVIDARDDHGLQALAIEARRAPRRDTAALVVAARIPLPPGTTDRALVSPRLELAPLGLVAGDTVTVVVAARDNSPAGQTGRSRALVLIVPTETEARAEQRSAQNEIARSLDSLVAASRDLERQTEDLSRERDRSQQRDREGSLGFEEAKKAEQVARDQQDLIDAAEEARERLADLEKSAERAGIADSAFQRQLQEIREQLDKALTPELRDRLDKLREALKKLDPQATREALKDLADAQKRLREALERSRELFKRAAVEGELSSLEQEAKQLVEEQKAWNDRVERADSNQAAAQESALAERTDSVAQGLDQAAQQLEAERSQAMSEAAEQMRQAAQEMRKAAQSSKSGKKQQAKQEGEQAAGQLSQAQQQVEEEREAQQQEWRQEVIDALDRALAETARLSQRQLALSNTIGRGSVTAASRAEQAVIEEGVQKILTQITEVSGKNALISPQIGAALVQARLQMARAREAIASASANLREAVDQAGEAVDALNVAAYQMLRSRDDVSGSSSASGLSEAIERMQQLAGQQGSLSQEGNNLLSMLGSPQFQEQLSGLAERQRQVAEELERMRAQGDAPGAAELAEEARELARKLEASRLDPETTARQERLFRRMLDAGRSLQGEEKDESKERESTTARSDTASVPAPLRRLLDRDGRIRLPSWEELQRLSPEERRLVTDYFRRLTSREGR